MVNPIMNPDDTEQELVQSFHEFVSNHWFFNGREKGPKIVRKPFVDTCEMVSENND